jgi:protein transport protein SEC20
MSFQAVSDRLKDLQESNAQLKELIERLATIDFQPGSIPLGDDEDNVVVELTTEIQQIVKDQDEEFELLLEEVLDLDAGREGSELRQQQKELDAQVRRAMKELKMYVASYYDISSLY